MEIRARISRWIVGGVGLIALIWGVTQIYEIYQRPWKLLYEKYPGRHWARKDQQGAYLRPKIAVFDEETGRRDVIHYRLPAEIRANSPTEVRTIVFASRSQETDSSVSYRESFGGSFGGGGRSPVRQKLYLRIYDTDLAAITNEEIVYGSAPPAVIDPRDRTAHIGGPPNDDDAVFRLSHLERR